MWPVTVTTACCWTVQAPRGMAALLGLSSRASGPAASAIAALTGSRITTVQVSSAEEVWLTSRAAAGPAGPAPAP
jgi:hypothetical protein